MSFAYGFGLPHYQTLSGGFSPLSLFGPGQIGAWYDPSDFSTLFQDSAGTTPVTAVEQVVGLMLDKSQGLVLGPELVTNGDFSSGTTGWTLEPGWSVSSGAAVGVLTGGWIYSANNIANISVNKLFRFEFTVVSLTAGGLRPFIFSSSPSATNYGNDVTTTGTFVQYILAPAGSGYRIGLQGRSGGFSGTVDNISVRELPGYHATATGTARPTLSARVNLLTKTEDFSDAVWTKSGATITQNAAVAPDGTTTADILVETATTAVHGLYNASGVQTPSGTTFTWVVYAKAKERSWLRIDAYTSPGTRYVWFDLVNVAVGTKDASITASIVNVGNGWCRCVATRTSDQASGIADGYIGIYASTGDNVTSYAGDGTSGLFIWGADLRVSNDGVNIPPYQRVNTATDYDTAGFPLYLSFAGAQAMSTPANIDFSGTDKMLVCAGVRKLLDGSSRFLLELSTDASANRGFFITAPSGTSPSYGTGVNLGTYVAISAGGAPAPDTAVLTMQNNGAAPSLSLRRNAAIFASDTSSQGANNFGSFPLFIGARNLASFFFNGRLYGLIVAGSQYTAGQVSATEAYMNSKTAAYV